MHMIVYTCICKSLISSSNHHRNGDFFYVSYIT